MTDLKKITFTKEENERVIHLNTENPYIYFVKLLIFDEAENINHSIDANEIHISYLTKGNETINGAISLTSLTIDKEFLVDSQINVDWQNIENITIKIDIKNTHSYKRIELYYEDFNFIENIEKKKDFATHIENNRNQKILFSAPFGEGKSTFLKYFFEQNEENYEVFKVFPVNYSVASNEDIFRYIKADVLFQLMGKGVTFDQESFSTSLSAQQYLLSSTKQVIKSLLKAGLSLSSETKGIVEAIDEIDKLISNFKTFKSESETDDKSMALKYIKELYEEEGNLYEDNFYTQLIRELLEQLNSKTNKKTVLIIDDLDRMDPEHIFRILNVISAHCDNYNIQGQEYHNKFGFDKIVVVCDINNIRSIFNHRYGKKVNFEGYINKFYSSEIFKFDGSILINYFVKSIEDKPYNIQYKESLFILKIFCDIGILNPRDLIKSFADINLSDIYRSTYPHLDSELHQRKLIDIGIWPLLNKLIWIYDKESLITKLDKPKKSKTLKANLKLLCGELMIGLLPNDSNDSEKYNYILNGRLFTMDLGQNYRNLFIKNIQVKVGQYPIEEYKYKEADFYELLIENIKLLES